MSSDISQNSAVDQTIATPDAATMIANRYRIVRALGAGGMGEVFLAFDETLNRTVAVKTIRQDLSSNEQISKRIERECLLHAKVGAHPHIVTLYDKLEDNGRIVLVMEYVEGETLLSMLEKNLKLDRPFAWGQAQVIVTQCLDALGRIHSQGIIHRDIKPSNILVAQVDGKLCAKLMDFGIARINDSSDDSMTKLTNTNAASPGTPMYMAPEQIDSRTFGAVRPATDIYAMGIVMYQCLNGYPPYTGTLTEILNGHLNLPLPTFEATRSVMVPEGLPSVLRRALSKNPDDRYQNAREFYDGLMGLNSEALVSAQTIITPSVGMELQHHAQVAQKQAKPAKSGPPIALLAGIAAFFLIMMGAAGWSAWYVASSILFPKEAALASTVPGAEPPAPVADAVEPAPDTSNAPAPAVENNDGMTEEEIAQLEEEYALLGDNPDPAPSAQDGTAPVVEQMEQTNPADPVPAEGTPTDATMAVDSAPVEDGVVTPAVETAETDPAEPAQPETYTVVSGDSLSKVASKFGMTPEALAYWNDITDPSQLAVGMVLLLTKPEGKSDTPPPLAKPKPVRSEPKMQADSETPKPPAQPEPEPEWESELIGKRWQGTDPDVQSTTSSSSGGSYSEKAQRRFGRPGSK